MTVPAHAPPRFDHALGTLYRELSPQLLRYAEGILGNRPDAEEAVQDAFVAATRAGRLDDARPWLFRVTRNAALDQLRRRRHLVALAPDGEPSYQASGPSPHEQAELSHDLGVLRRGLERLGEQQRSALMLRELAGLGYSEIAAVLDVSEANVKVLIFRGRRSLDEFARAARLPCESAQMALSARADGEAGVGEAARARLHTVTCRHCRDFAAAIGEQRAGLAMLVPLAPVATGAAAVALHAAAGAGAKAGGGIGGLFGLKTAAATIATVAVVSTGAVVAEKEGIVLRHAHSGHAPQLQRAGKRTNSFTTGRAAGTSAGTGRGPEGESRSGAGAGDDRSAGTASGGDGGGDASSRASGDGGGGGDATTSSGDGGDATTTATAGDGSTGGTTTGSTGGDRPERNDG